MALRRSSLARVVIAISLLGVLQPAAVLKASPAAAPTIDVAAAADLRYAFEEIGSIFQRETGVHPRFSFGSSGQLAAQVEQGAPFDVLFSADESYVQRLAQRGFIAANTQQLYAVGRIVMWVRTVSLLTVDRGFSVLSDPGVRYVAIANPEHAPYGRAAQQALQKAGVYEQVRSKIVYGENVGLTLQLVQTGNADVGIAALSLALAPPIAPQGRYWLIPSNLHAPIRQGAGVVSRSAQQNQARSFLAFVNGATGRPIMRRYGFVLPGEAP